MKRILLALAICALPHVGRGAILSTASANTLINLGDFRAPTDAFTGVVTVKINSDIGHANEAPLTKRVNSGSSPYISYGILLSQTNAGIEPFAAVGLVGAYCGTDNGVAFPNFAATGPHTMGWTWNQNASVDLYIDGKLFNSHSGCLNAVISYDGTGMFEIGRDLTDGTTFGGEISDVAIWNVRLTDAQMKLLTQNGVRRALNHGLPRPLRYYPLDVEAPAYTTIPNTPMNIYDVIGSSNGSTSGNVLFVGSRQPIP